MSKVVSLDELAARVAPGTTIAIGGFQASRVPLALLRAIAARGTGDLAAISAPNPLALEVLAAAGCLRSADCGFIGVQYESGFLIPAQLRRAVGSAAVDLRQRDVYETIGELRAAIADDRPVADASLLHVQRADAAGNLGIDDPYADRLIAGGGRIVLATAEELVERVVDPVVRGDRVAAVSIVPTGAAPASCLGYYPRDPQALDGWLLDEEASGPDGTSGAGPASAPEAGSRSEPDSTRNAMSAEARERIDTFLCELARQVRDHEVIVTGLASAVPMMAITLARATHAPKARYINCVGAVNPRIAQPFFSSVEPRLLEACEETIELPDIFDLARDGGVDAMFFGAAQVDRAGNINLSRVGPAHAPRGLLPGPAGSLSMRSFVRRVLISVPRQSRRNLVEDVDAAASSPSERNEETTLITDLATWRLTDVGFQPQSVRQGVTSPELTARTGYEVTEEGQQRTPPPRPEERAALHQLDPQGERFRLFASRAPSRPSSQSATTSSERVVS